MSHRCNVSPSDEFRKQADIAINFAARSSKDTDKAFWLSLARSWQKLLETAAETDRRQLGRSGLPS